MLNCQFPHNHLIANWEEIVVSLAASVYITFSIAICPYMYNIIYHMFQLVIIASVAMTVFLRTRMGVDVLHANYYLGALFYALVILLVDGFPELSLTVARLSIFYKQRELYFYPAWAYAIPSAILKVPFSLLEAVVWTSLTYYVIGYTPEVGR